MGLVPKTQIFLANRASLKEFVLENMFFFGNSVCVFLWSYILHVFGLIFGHFLRFSGKKSVENGSDFDDVCGKTDEGIGEIAEEKMGFDQTVEKEIQMLDSEGGSVCNPSTSKYQFFAGNSVCAFIEEPQTISFTVQEMFVISNDESPSRQDSLEKDGNILGFSVDLNDNSFSHDLVIVSNSSENEDSGVLRSEEEGLQQGKVESSVSDLSCEEHESLSSSIEDELYEKEEIVDLELEDRVLGKHEFHGQVHLSVANSDDFWASIHKFDGFLGCKGNEILCDSETPLGVGDKRVDYNEDSLRLMDGFAFDQNHLQLDDVSVESEHEGTDSSYIELEPQSDEHMTRDEFSDSDSEELDQENSTFDDLKVLDASENCDGAEDQMGSDVLLEQKELIRQMKKEMRQLKISGLPTILEESESPRVEDDLRPLRIDERIGHKDRMDEIQTFYKRYLERMRKLDITSQQTMYAIGLLQLKNQDLTLNKKTSVPVIKSLLAQNFWSYKLRKHEADPVQKLIRDLRRDLELAYVGQLCLSWEMLKWQHHKAQELQAHDPEGFRQHNQVAGEFQKFQVLLQRFVEDEPFHQGPRVQHYVKSRCALPSLLQVPLIKDDPRSEWRNAEGGFSIRMLKEVIVASMRSFWEFLRADKDEVHAIPLMGIHGVQVDLQDPSDMEVLIEVRSILQKKEKRLKDLVRSGNCLVKKFQKHQNQRLSNEMFVAQVELRLVSRVLSMSKLTTDQLLWCHKKLNKINIIGRKIYLEPSFSLFPC